MKMIVINTTRKQKQNPTNTKMALRKKLNKGWVYGIDLNFYKPVTFHSLFLK